MANTAAAKKAFRVSQRRRLQNKPTRTRARTAVRQALAAIDGGDWEAADRAVNTAVAELDQAAHRGVVHANNAARRKSRLLRHYHAVRPSDHVARPRQRPPVPVEVRV